MPSDVAVCCCREQGGSLVLLVAAVQDLLAIRTTSSRLISHANPAELLTVALVILSAASLIAVVVAYLALKGRQNRSTMLTIASLAVLVFVAQVTLGIFFMIFFNQVSAEC